MVITGSQEARTNVECYTNAKTTRDSQKKKTVSDHISRVRINFSEFCRKKKKKKKTHLVSRERRQWLGLRDRIF